MVTVKELIEILQKEDPNKVVVMSRDPEGNGYSTLCDIDGNSRHDLETGETGLETLTEDLKVAGYTDEDVMSYPDAVSCIVFWPTN